MKDSSPNPNGNHPLAPTSRNAKPLSKNQSLLVSIKTRDFKSSIRILDYRASSGGFNKETLLKALIDICRMPEIDEHHDVDSVVYALLKYGAPEDFDGNPPRMWQRGKPLVVFAVQRNWSRSLTLLDARPNILYDLENLSSLTLLSIASVHDSVEAAQYLVANGADIDAISTDGSALMYALKSGSNRTARFLVENGANKMLKMDHDVVSEFGPWLLSHHRTCVGAAIVGGDMTGLRFLFEHGPQRTHLVELRDVILSLDIHKDRSKYFPVVWITIKLLHQVASLLAEQHP